MGISKIAEEVGQLRERVEDLEDLCDLKDAVQRNGNQALIPLSKIKNDLDFD